MSGLKVATSTARSFALLPDALDVQGHASCLALVSVPAKRNLGHSPKPPPKPISNPSEHVYSQPRRYISK